MPESALVDEIAALSVRAAAKKLSMSEWAIARLIAERAIPSFKLGRRRLIREAALADYLRRVETIPR